MRRSLSRCLALTMVLLCGGYASAQQPPQILPEPRISSIFPAGARAGATVEVRVNGFDLTEEGAQLIFADGKIRAELIPHPKPEEDPKKKDQKPKPIPTNFLTFKVTVPNDYPRGAVEARVSNKQGLSNSRLFAISQYPELEEVEPNNDVPEAQKVELNTVINGIINNNTDVDYFTFEGKAGQRILAHCATQSIDSRARPLLELYSSNGSLVAQNRNYQGDDALLDAKLPSDGEYFLRLCEFAYLGGGPDYFYRLTLTDGPWVDGIFPNVVNPGKSTAVTVYGRNLPNGKPVPNTGGNGKPALEMIQTNINAPGGAQALEMNYPGRISPVLATSDGFAFQLQTPQGLANPVPVFFATHPIQLETEADNNRLANAQKLNLPADLIGRFEKSQDRDCYSFDAKQGEVYQIELYADRIGSSSDTVFEVFNSEGKHVVGEQDDNNDSVHPIIFYTRNNDPPSHRFTVPADGTYTVVVSARDSAVNFGPLNSYRLRIAPPQPDYRLVAMPRSRTNPQAWPMSATGEADGTVPIDVFVERIDGFNEPITLRVDGLPGGVKATPGFLGTAGRWSSVVLHIPGNAGEHTGPIRIVGTADSNGQKIERVARATSITWPVNNNVPALGRLDQQLLLAIRPERKAWFNINAEANNAMHKTKAPDGKDTEGKAQWPLFAKPGDKITVPVKLQWKHGEARPNQLNVLMEPTHIGNQNAPVVVNNNNPVGMPKDKQDVAIVIDVKPNAPPGRYSVALRGETQVQVARDPQDPNKKSPAFVAQHTEPMELTVLPTELAKVAVKPPEGNKIEQGQTGEITVTVDRQHGYQDPLEVELKFPDNAKGVSAKKVTIPKGESTIAVPIEVKGDANPGGINNVQVLVVGKVHNKFDISQEAKFNFNVAPAPKKDK